MTEGSRPPAPGQRGLQPERTALAWDRTGLAFLVVGALLLRVGGPPYPHARHLAGAASILVGGMVVVAAIRMRPRTSGTATQPRPLLLVRLVGASAVGISMAALVLVVLDG